MNKRQINSLSMFKSVKNYSLLNGLILNTITHYNENSNKLTIIIDKIEAAEEKQNLTFKGAYIDKDNVRDKMIEFSIDTGIKIEAYSKIIKNNTLLEEMKSCMRRLKADPESERKSLAQTIYDRAEINLSLIGEYGVTADTQVNLLNSMMAFEKALETVKTFKGSKAEITKELEELFTSGYEILDIMDSLVGIIRTTQPEIYNGYKQVRRIVNTATNNLNFRCKVVDFETGLPLKAAEVSMQLISKGDKAVVAEPIIRKTAKKGGTETKNTPNGTYVIKVNKEGYDEFEDKAVIVAGEFLKLNVKLKKKK